MRYAIKEEIKSSQHLDIIENVQDPQEWIRNLSINPKSNGKVCLYLDARTINTSFKRELYTNFKFNN